MQLDEIIASNLRRIREERDLPKTQLAERLDMGRHRVQDFERPRRGNVHSFKWSELVALCDALECSIFELVLPGEGEVIDVPEWRGTGRLHEPGSVRREELAQVVFHAPYEVLEQLGEVTAHGFEEWRDRVRQAEIEANRKAEQTRIETFRAALADIEGETE